MGDVPAISAFYNSAMFDMVRMGAVERDGSDENGDIFAFGITSSS